MANSDIPPTDPPPEKLDIQVLNNGVKLVGETIVPGASLLLENHVGGGLTYAALGVLGGMALKSAFGPLGYILARYGASAASFSQSLQPPPPENGSKTQQIAAATGAAVANSLSPTLARLSDILQAVPERTAHAFERSMQVGGFAPAAAAGQGDVSSRVSALEEQLARIDSRLESILSAVEASSEAGERRAGARRRSA
jgi:hypothetical protein